MQTSSDLATTMLAVSFRDGRKSGGFGVSRPDPLPQKRCHQAWLRLRKDRPRTAVLLVGLGRQTSEMTSNCD